MEKIKALLIDDEQNCLEVLEWIIAQYCPYVQILKTCSSAEEGRKAIQSLKPDLVFLDIQMPHMNGFDMLKPLLPIRFDVIFTTAYDQFAIKAFKFNAIDYLLKPIDPNELVQAMEKVRKNHLSQAPSVKVDELLQSLKHLSQPQKNKLPIPAMDGLLFVNLSDIISCESESNYTIFSMRNAEKITATRTLKIFTEILEPYAFFRVHQSYLINLEHISRYVRGEGGHVIMSDGSSIQVSRSCKERFLQQINAR